MDHIELFHALAARSPKTAGSYIAEMWCEPVLNLYAIDISKLHAKCRDEVIESRVAHKREFQAVYQWLWNLADTNPNGVYAESMSCVDQTIADFAKRDVDAKSFVLDVTGWTAHDLSLMQQSG